MSAPRAFAAAIAALALTCQANASTLLLADNFETMTSGNYTVVDDSNGASGDGTPDSTIDFGFDYVAAGIPLAPNSTAGDTLALRLAANETADDAGAPDHITAFNNLSVTSTNYKISVDMYMAVEAAGGTTEFAHVGIGGSTADFLSIFTPVVDNGHFVAITGEGGSASDYRHSVPGSPAVPSGDLSYLNSDNTTNATGDTYQTIFAGAEFPGSPGNQWTTLEIFVNPSLVTYALDGTPIIQTANAGTDGLVGLGYTDAFSSVGPHFVLYDNLTITETPEPAAGLLSLLGLAGLAVRRRRAA